MKINNISKKLEKKLIKLEHSCISVLKFLVKLILWAALLFLLVPILANLFVQIFHKDIALNDFILLITAAFIIVYTYETQKTREQMKENDLRPVILRTGFIEKWNNIRFSFDGNKLIEGKPIEFKILRGIATSIQGHIIIDGFKYHLLFASNISNLGEKGFYFSEKWGWMGPNTSFFAIFNGSNKKKANGNNEIYLTYSDIEGTKYYSYEDADFLQESGTI